MNTMNMDPIDGACIQLQSLLRDLKRWIPTIQNEQDTRLKIIDPIFIQVLGWDPSSISTEEPTGDGFLDYKFSIDGRARLIVEAKKIFASFNINTCTPGKAYKLSGPALSGKTQQHDGVLQAIRYCGAKNAELACVTNGFEWIIFRGSRLGDGVDTLSGVAFLFPSIESLNYNFRLFYDLLGRPRVEKYVYRAHFQEAEGQPIRAKAFSRTLRPVDAYRLIPKSPLSLDIESIMTAFFRKISGDDDPVMLSECFVTTKESQIADESLVRITDDLVSKIRNLDTNEGSALTEVIKRIHETQRNEFVLIVGTKGAGKSTFIDRFFRSVLPAELLSKCVIVRLDVGHSAGDLPNVTSWLNKQLRDELEKALYGQNGPTFDELQGMYFDEYQRWMKGTYKFLYDSDKVAFKMKFGAHLEDRREKYPDDYIKRLIRHIVFSRLQVPCLIFDNTDHFSIDFQEAVFRYARSLYENEMCLILIPITDKTSWQLSQQGALQSFDNQAFFLPTPPPKIVIERRIQFIETRLNEDKKEKGTGYFAEKGIHLSFENLHGFVMCLQKVFIETGEVSQWIGQLSNNDIRRCLKLLREVVASPYLRINDLLKAYISKNSYAISGMDVRRAIIRKGYDIYPTGQHEFVQNVFSLNTEVDSTPLLGLRVLRLLRDAKHHDATGLQDYVTIEQVLEYLQAIGIERRATSLCLDAILKTGLCFGNDPTVKDIGEAKMVQLSPCGLQHLHWGTWDETYIGTMLQVTPIANEATYNQIHTLPPTLSRDIKWRTEVSLFLKHLIEEDALFIQDLPHPTYEGQRKLIKAIRIKIRKLEITE